MLFVIYGYLTIASGHLTAKIVTVATLPIISPAPERPAPVPGGTLCWIRLVTDTEVETSSQSETQRSLNGRLGVGEGAFTRQRKLDSLW